MQEELGGGDVPDIEIPTTTSVDRDSVDEEDKSYRKQARERR
jgi:hypothetical protein